MNKRFIVAGATGEIGRRLVQTLVVQNPNAEIHLLVRAHSQLFGDDIQQHVVDFDKLDEFKLDLTFDRAFCCLGTTIKQAGSQANFKHVDHHLILQFAHWSQAHGCVEFACISAVGANTKSSNFYLATKGQTERDLQQMHWQALWFIRPSLLLGHRDEFRLGEYLGAIIGRLISPFLVGRLTKYKPINMLRVAQVMADLPEYSADGQNHTILEGKDLFKD